MRNLYLPLLLLISIQSHATHIVGGELNYTDLGNYRYEIRLTVYRDCKNGQAPFDDPASIGVFDQFNNLLFQLLVPINDTAPVPPTLSSPCLIPPVGICYDVAHYITDTILPPLAGGYQLVYERCCRNGTIINITNPLASGATYYATIPDPSVVTVNSNPVFKNWPPTFICVGEPFVFDHSATDLDGDHLVYTLCAPLDGPASLDDTCFHSLTCCAALGFLEPCGPEPQPPYNPPFVSVNWQPPYSPANVFGGVPLTIDPVTGILTCTPNTLGQFVYGVCCQEYRNGKYLGETKRDFQVNIVACPKLTVAALAASTSKCGNLTANFQNNSVGASSYQWNFGDSTTTGDTSNLATPSYTYPDSGTYNVVLVAYSGVNNACNDTSTTTVTLYPPLQTNFTYIAPPCSNVVTFKDSSSQFSGAVTSWDWDFGDGNTSTMQNPTHTYSSVGTFSVTLISSSSHGCTDTITKSINLATFNADFNYYIGCNDSVYFSDTLALFSDTISKLNWNFGDGDTSTLQNPNHVYTSTGQYPVSLVLVTNSGCTDTVSKTINVTKFKADFNYNSIPCNDTVSFQDNSSQAGDSVILWDWNFGDAGNSTIANPVHIYKDTGTFSITLIATTLKGCSDSVTKPFSLLDNGKAAFTTSIIPCRPEVHFIDSSVNAQTYRWDFGDGSSSNAPNPVHVYQNLGTYNVTLVINPGTFCNDSMTSIVNYDNAEVLPHFLPNSFTPNNDGINDVFYVTGQNICETVELVVYNRWGQVIFQTTDITTGWDGKIAGQVVSEGVYVYILKGEGWDRYGTITVIR